jgi:hypothetical protein
MMVLVLISSTSESETIHNVKQLTLTICSIKSNLFCRGGFPRPPVSEGIKCLHKLWFGAGGHRNPPLRIPDFF